MSRYLPLMRGRLRWRRLWISTTGYWPSLWVFYMGLWIINVLMPFAHLLRMYLSSLSKRIHRRSLLWRHPFSLPNTMLQLDPWAPIGFFWICLNRMDFGHRGYRCAHFVYRTPSFAGVTARSSFSWRIVDIGRQCECHCGGPRWKSPV